MDAPPAFHRSAHSQTHKGATFETLAYISSMIWDLIRDERTAEEKEPERLNELKKMQSEENYG